MAHSTKFLIRNLIFEGKSDSNDLSAKDARPDGSKKKFRPTLVTNLSKPATTSTPFKMMPTDRKQIFFEPSTTFCNPVSSSAAPDRLPKITNDRWSDNECDHCLCEAPRTNGLRLPYCAREDYSYPCWNRYPGTYGRNKAQKGKSVREVEALLCRPNERCGWSLHSEPDRKLWQCSVTSHASRREMTSRKHRIQDSEACHEDLAWIVNPRPFYKKETKKQKRENELKRDRTTFTKEQRYELEKQFFQGRYPSRYQRADTARKLGLTEFQVKVWFQNRRMKYKRWSSAHMCFYNPGSLCYCPLNYTDLGVNQFDT